MTEIIKELTKKEELLLSRFMDGECGIIGRYLANRLISSNQAASEMIQQFQAISRQIVQNNNQAQTARVDLWNKIGQRIDQEEKTEFYLGKRSQAAVSKENDGILSRLDLSKIGWGLSGGLVTASIGFIIFSGLRTGRSHNGVYTPPSFVNGSEADALIRQNQLKSVNYSDQQASAAVPQFARKPVEVDWMRSDGRVHMIQNQGERSAVIWVKRPDPSLTSNSIDSQLDNSLFGTNDKSFQSNQPVILKDRIPNSLSVSNNH